MNNRKIALTGVLCFLGIDVARCAAVSINFDMDAFGNPLVATGDFLNHQPLRTTYSSLGVTFSGPSPLDGGAILNQIGNFGVNARSAPNFLAFNRHPTVTMQNGGSARDPETLTFSPPISAASIYGSGGTEGTTFRMEAFDAGGISLSVTTATNAPASYVLLSVASATPIARVVLNETGGDNHFVFDDLSFTQVPEPASVTALPVVLTLLRRRSRSRLAARGARNRRATPDRCPEREMTR